MLGGLETYLPKGRPGDRLLVPNREISLLVSGVLAGRGIEVIDLPLDVYSGPRVKDQGLD